MASLNWARNIASQPTRILAPSSEDELVAMVADSAPSRIRLVGGDHSWSDIAATDAVRITLDGMHRILSVDGERVTVEAGVRIHALSAALHARGLALSNLGSIGEQSIAGAISTATHGSGRGHGVLSTQVIGLRLLTMDGRILALSAQAHPALFDAARVGLGCLGIITAVTLQCVPAFRLTERMVPLSVDAAAACIPELVAAGEYVKLWWLPGTDRVLVFTASRTDAPAAPRPVKEWLDAVVINPLIFTLVLRLGGRFPWLISTLSSMVAAIYFRPDVRTDHSHRILHIPMPPRHLESEYAIPVERAGEALLRLRALIAANKLGVNFVQELRFVAADDLPLSPANGRDSCYVGAYTAAPKDAGRYFAAFEALMAELGGRPHWGKLFERAPAQLAAAYPDWSSFCALRTELDPDGRLVNPFISRVLGL
ncbi:MAG: D-arabinono-1,4-lactone oxidase [Myxococcota bacterium]|nr:D-arabinono-1,4-lactone oxidase [Myxococcota bacterium]